MIASGHLQPRCHVIFSTLSLSSNMYTTLLHISSLAIAVSVFCWNLIGNLALLLVVYCLQLSLLGTMVKLIQYITLKVIIRLVAMDSHWAVWIQGYGWSYLWRQGLSPSLSLQLVSLNKLLELSYLEIPACSGQASQQAVVGVQVLSQLLRQDVWHRHQAG